MATAASLCHFLVGVEDFHRFVPTLVDIPHLRIDRLDAITAVSKPFERALQPTPIDLGFVREAVELVEVIVANRQILGNSPQVVLALLEIPDARFGRFATGSEEAYNGQNQHGYDNQRHNDEQHSGLDADIAEEPWPLARHRWHLVMYPLYYSCPAAFCLRTDQCCSITAVSARLNM